MATAEVKMPLPHLAGLDIAVFAGLFRDTVTSYKFLWMLSILNIVSERRYDSTLIPMRLIVAHMLESAYYPIYRFRLDFGNADMMKAHLQKLQFLPEWTNMKLRGAKISIAEKYRQVPDSICRTLTEMVPFRLLAPFFESEIRGLRKLEKNRKIAQLAMEQFDLTNPPLYCFAENHGEKCIMLHPEWMKYLRINSEVVRAWAMWHWLNYLQVRNPNMPNIAAKIAKPESRRSLASQTEFWNSVIEKCGGFVRCLYSDAKLGKGDFALDHYLPWNFIAHDNLWNLIPVCGDINSAKSDSLPHEKYLGKFVDSQYNALQIYHRHFCGKWSRLMESYTADLHLKTDIKKHPLSEEKLRLGYDRVIPPLIRLAENFDFPSGWEYILRPKH